MNPRNLRIVALALSTLLIFGCEDDHDHDHDTSTTNDTSTGETTEGDATTTEDTVEDTAEPWVAGEDCSTIIEPSDDDQTTALTAFIGASDGDIICFAPGTYTYEGELSLDVANVTLRGAGMGRTILDFSAQTSGANGIAVTSDGFTVTELTVADAAGDGIRVTGATDVTFLNTEVIWTAGAKTANGAYGLYPVQCTNVHIEGCKVSGASDAGVYVGQSTNILVKDNEVYLNVAGIEIENSTDAEVVGNNCHDNTGGILIFDLPGLPVQDGKRTKVHNNTIVNNNTGNFAPEGNIVGNVPAGSGIIVLASDSHEIHDNTITGNQSLGLAFVSYFTFDQEFDPSSDPGYDPYPEGSYTHDNVFADNGTRPQGITLLISAGLGLTQIEDMVVDGIDDGSKDNSDGSLTNCFMNNTDGEGGDATFRNLDAANDFAGSSTDITPFECTRDALPAITP